MDEIEESNEDFTDKVTGHSDYKPDLQDTKAKYHLSSMYRTWFLDYASYVNLERAIPHINDGLKPVQRRVLHAMKRLDDGRYNKVANIVGHTMQFHPHGDASIGDALVNLGQKNLLIDCQGNWGNILTGDGAAAPRYIEARLSKFALDAVFNPKTTPWKSSYDGRNKEPIFLPIKFPLLLAQGSEGIGLGLNSRILPHNFNELLDASIAYLRNKPFQLYPDFPTGGLLDVSRYDDGERGGSVKIRAKIEKIDNRTLAITELPYGMTTSSLIETIVSANDKGKINIKKVEDNTSANVEILVHLEAKTSSDKTIDALYAFTKCEVSYSPNCCVIDDNKPHFITVSEVLRRNTNKTVNLLTQELNIQRNELLDQLNFASLEKIFIEERIYKDKEFENAATTDIALDHIDKRLEPFKKDFVREVTRDDLARLLEIKMARILKFNVDKAKELIAQMHEQIKQIDYNLEHIVDYAIDWFSSLKKKYGKDYPRLTELRSFETIEAAKVVEANEKLYINREEGFIGTGLKKDEFVCNCSDIDDIILFFKDGKYKVVKVTDKMFVGKNLLYLAVFVKNDQRTIYNVVYRDGRAGNHYIKRFAVSGVTRDKEYDLTQGTANSKVVYFSANPNGEAETIKVFLKPTTRRIKNLIFEKDFSEIAIKGRQAMGNILTKFDVHKILLKQKGGSTLGGTHIWFDPDVLRLNSDKRGNYIGEFFPDDLLLVMANNGTFYTTDFDLNKHFEDDVVRIEKFDAKKVWAVALFDADQGYAYIKRFTLEESTKRTSFIGENPASKLYVLSDQAYPRFEVIMGGNDSSKEPFVVDVEEFIGTKSYKARGKRITTWNVKKVTEIEPLRFPEPDPTEKPDTDDKNTSVEESVSNTESKTVEAPPTNDFGDIEIVTVDTTKEESSETKSKKENGKNSDAIDEITGQMRLF
ncbi:MAG TPA: DNA gyrase/topoisomerase IV subunit A [Paludibacteraceae bacterium]|nr:DNA gyrase/topoisomerase IV subunit A [Paludibacteraceae bacterium]